MNYRLCCVLFLLLCSSSADCGSIEIEDANTLKEGYTNLMRKLGEITHSLNDLRSDVSRLTNEDSIVKSSDEQEIPKATSEDGDSEDFLDEPGQIHLAASSDFVNVTLQHQWPNTDVIWYICSEPLTDIPGQVAIYNDSNAFSVQVWTGGRYFDRLKECSIDLQLIIGEHRDSFFNFDLDKLLVKMGNETTTSENNGDDGVVSIVEPVRLARMQVGRGFRQKYGPGEQLAVDLRMKSTDFITTDHAWIHVYFFVNDSLHVMSGQTESNELFEATGNMTNLNSGDTITITFNTTRIPEGAIVYFGWECINRNPPPDGSLLHRMNMGIVIYFIPRSSSDPVQYGTIGFETYYNSPNQNMSLDGPNSLSCHAIGNPQPSVEFYINGEMVIGNALRRYKYEYGNRLTLVLPNKVPENVLDGEVECRAEAIGKERILTFNIGLKAEIVESLSHMDRMSANKISMTCAARGRPIPNLRLYRNYATAKNIVNSTDPGVTITTQESASDMLATITMTVDLDKYKPMTQYGYEDYISGFACIQYYNNGENNRGVYKFFVIE